MYAQYAFDFVTVSFMSCKNMHLKESIMNEKNERKQRKSNNFQLCTTSMPY